MLEFGGGDEICYGCRERNEHNLLVGLKSRASYVELGQMEVGEQPIGDQGRR